MFLVYNVVTEDRLTKGARDVLLGAEKEDGMVKRLIVRFYNPSHGQEHRDLLTLVDTLRH